MSEKPPYEPETAALERFFSDDGPYQPEQITVHHPGKRMFTAEDPDGDLLAVNWEGGDRFSYDQDDQTQPLPEDDPLYEVATDLLAAYPVTIFEADGSQRYGTVAHTNSGGEASQALNHPLEWGIETGYRTWEERQDDHDSLLGRLADLL